MARLFSLVVAMAVSIVLSSIAVDVEATSRMSSGQLLQIVSACKHTDYPDVCVRTAKLMQKSGPITIFSIAKISIQTAIDNALKANEAAVALMHVDHGSKMRHADFQVCQQEYLDAVSSLKTSVQSLEAGAHADLMDNLSAAMSSYSTCDDSFIEMNEVSPLAHKNELLTKITSNCLALAQALTKRQ